MENYILKRIKLSFLGLLLFEINKYQLNTFGKIIMYILCLFISLPVFPIMFLILLLLNNEQIEDMNVYN